jgi:hypothetical protein
MGVNYNNTNRSGARASRRKGHYESAAPLDIVYSGTKIWLPVYGEGVTSETFLSNCDKVLCEFSCGVSVVLRGAEIRIGVNEYDRKNQNLQ